MNTPRENDDCQTLAPFVMALFDGEADELEAQRARAHLLVCQICARRWLDWNRSRDLLRAVPVPAPPPTLLWRVLMACRLAAFARKRRSGLGDSLGLSASAAKKTDTEFAPRDLSAQILARTTRVEMPPSREPRRRAIPVFALPSLAVPALAIWLIALQGDTPWNASPPETPLSDAAPQLAATPRRAAVSSPRKLIAQPVASAKKPPAPRRAAATRVLAAPAPLEIPEREVEAPPVASPPVASPPVASPPVVPQRVVRAAPRAVTVALAPVSPRPAAAPSEHSVAVPQVTPPQPRVLASAPFSGSPRLTVLSTPKNTPQLRTARWKTSAPRLIAAVEKAAPGALPSRVSPPAAPAPAPPLLLAGNFEADDEGVEEMRAVVDDFRAA
ncbi:MAG: hypothetical protein KY445_03625, partial [Armatimonadetes bacterium]|nr:hypothetical protein [Armatimonadota bacterium]